MKLIKSILEIFKKGLLSLAVFISRGFYFYFLSIVKFLKKIFKFKWFDKAEKFLEIRQEEPEYLLILILLVISGVMVYNIYIPQETLVVHNNINDEDETVEIANNDNTNNEVVEQQQEEPQQYFETNLFRIYGKYDLKSVKISDLKSKNSNTVAWLSVDGTNINYPIVQTTDNSYYLNHSYDDSTKASGWTFMDYRNDINMTDKNTIFYGHNLLNKTAFGSISNIFTDKWMNNSNKTIVILTEKKKLVYQVISGYYATPETYYLQTNFYSNEDYQDFLNVILNRNILRVDNTATIEDRIITMSTCTEDNAGRKVIHAKLIDEKLL